MPNFLSSDDEEEVEEGGGGEGDEESEDDEKWWGDASKPVEKGGEQLEESTMSVLIKEEEKNGKGDSSIKRSSSDEEVETVRARPIDHKPITAARTSIFFNPSQPNPLVSPDTGTIVSESIEDSVLEINEESWLAVSLHSFEGRKDFGELEFLAGEELRIEVEDLGGGWSLGYLVASGVDGRGLVPRGWYAYVEEETESADSPPLPPFPAAPIPIEPSSPPIVSLSLPSPPLLPVPAPPNTIDDSELHSSSSTLENRGRARSIGTSIIISGVEFEPTDTSHPTIPSWLLPRNKIEFFGLEADSIEPPTSQEHGLISKKGANSSSNGVEVVEVEVKEDFGEEVNASVVETKGLDLENGFGETIPVDQPLEQVDESPIDQSRPSSIVITETLENGDSSRTQILSSSTASTLSIPSRILALQSAKPLALVASTNLSSTTAQVSVTRSLSLPSLYRQGLGSLSRSYSLSSIGLGVTKQSILPNLKGKVIGLVEEWIERGESISGDIEGDEAAANHFIENGPIWRSEDSSTIKIEIHSPERRMAVGGKSEHISYSIETTVYDTDIDEVTIEVERRYSHFMLLYNLLKSRYPIISIQNLPPKKYSGRFRNDFIESRRRGLEVWCNRIVEHPILGASEEMKGFLGLEQDSELKDLLSPHESSRGLEKNGKFFSSVFHPDFNFDIDDAKEIGDNFESFVRGVEGEAMKTVGNGLEEIRESSLVHANSLRQFAQALYNLIDRPGLESKQATHDAWTWKDHSDVALSLSKAVQATAESIHEISLLIDKNARTDSRTIQELIQEISTPHSNHSSLIDTHKAAVATFYAIQESMEESRTQNESKLARCETIINITLAEIEQVHISQVKNLKTVTESFLDSQIALHQASLDKLLFARSHFSEPNFTSLALTGNSRLPSRLLSSQSFPAGSGFPRLGFGYESRKLDPRDLTAEFLRTNANLI